MDDGEQMKADRQTGIEKEEEGRMEGKRRRWKKRWWKRWRRRRTNKGGV